ncbi:MAG: VOC family protein [Pygmaiobacter sp.]|nr:VOC family protein [Pygmaiobacter sp.]
MEELRLGNVMVDCPDSKLLADFYAALLGWQRLVLYGLPAVRSNTGVVLLFAQEEDYASPTWPEVPGKQQKQLHLDFQVPDVAAAVERALSLGATKAAAQFGEGQFVTMLDPAGHPFCLCKQG